MSGYFRKTGVHDQSTHISKRDKALLGENFRKKIFNEEKKYKLIDISTVKIN